MRQVILASQSPQRKLIFDTLNIDYKVVPSKFDESSIKENDLRKRAKIIALKKASTIAAKHPKAIVIAADTYVIYKDQALEKPDSVRAAIEMLQLLSNQWSVAVTGYAYLDKEGKLEQNTVVETLAKFRQLSEKEIDYYCKNQPVTGWSAAFCPGYPEGASLIEKTQGSLTSFLYGLPMELVTRDLLDSGIAI